MVNYFRKVIDWRIYLTINGMLNWNGIEAKTYFDQKLNTLIGFYCDSKCSSAYNVAHWRDSWACLKRSPTGNDELTAKEKLTA